MIGLTFFVLKVSFERFFFFSFSFFAKLILFLKSVCLLLVRGNATVYGTVYGTSSLCTCPISENCRVYRVPPVP